MSDVKTRIDDIVKAHDVVLFMKGSTLFPVSYTHLDVYKRQAGR